MKTSEFVFENAQREGFDHFSLFDAKKLVFREDVRGMCADGRCGSYGKRWTCPPHCGSLEDSNAIASAYSSGIILQMTGEMEDDFDIDCMADTEKRIKEKFYNLVKLLREAGIKCLPMGAGTCSVCKECTCPNEPCRFPDRAFVSMEAYGLMVADVCTMAGVRYGYGPRTITFSTCVLFNE